MLSVEKVSNALDNKKNAAVTTPLSEKKVLKTEKVTTSDEVHKLTENITTSEDIDKGTGEFHKRTEKITKSEEVEKVTENWRI